MTWEQWINSEYNTINATLSENGMYINAEEFTGISAPENYLHYDRNENVSANDLIIKCYTYRAVMT